MHTSEFAFVLCQPGAEAVLKRELLRTRPDLAPAYQRPGLVTLRARQPLAADFALDAVFARCHGLSLGGADSAHEVLERLAHVPGPLVLHVVERPSTRADADAHPPYPASPSSRALSEQLRAIAPERFLARERAEADDWVTTVVLAAGDPLLVGLHRHGRGRSPYAGGAYAVDVPHDAPSRAYAKIEEAIQVFDLDVRPGETALELGAAPGGAAFALLRRGVHVIGVDPGEMDAHVRAFVGPGGARLTHHAFKASALTSKHLAVRVQHLLIDVHLAPPVALRALRKALSLVRDQVRDVVWTVKLNQWSMADQLEAHLAELRTLGVRDARARQLVANRQEVCIAGRVAR